jgi:hypothetical protein
MLLVVEEAARGSAVLGAVYRSADDAEFFFKHTLLRLNVAQ